MRELRPTVLQGAGPERQPENHFQFVPDSIYERVVAVKSARRRNDAKETLVLT